jgi:hypothetical protein
MVEVIPIYKTLDAYVRGYEYVGTVTEGSASATNPDLPNPPGKVGYDINSSIVEYPDLATEIATLFVAKYKTTRDRVSLKVPGPLAADVLDTIAITAAPMALSALPYMVMGVDHQLGSGGWTASIKAERFY